MGCGSARAGLAAQLPGEAKVHEAEEQDNHDKGADECPDDEEGGGGAFLVDGVEAGEEADAQEEDDEAADLAEADAAEVDGIDFDLAEAGGGAGVEHVVPARGGDGEGEEALDQWG